MEAKWTEAFHWWLFLGPAETLGERGSALTFGSRMQLSFNFSVSFCTPAPAPSAPHQLFAFSRLIALLLQHIVGMLENSQLVDATIGRENDLCAKPSVASSPLQQKNKGVVDPVGWQLEQVSRIITF